MLATKFSRLTSAFKVVLWPSIIVENVSPLNDILFALMEKSGLIVKVDCCIVTLPDRLRLVFNTNELLEKNKDATLVPMVASNNPDKVEFYKILIVPLSPPVLLKLLV